MGVDVDKYQNHKLICQTCDPAILLNATSNTCRLVTAMVDDVVAYV